MGESLGEYSFINKKRGGEMYFSIPFSFISMPFISKSTLLCLFFVVTLPSVLNKVKDMMWLLLAFLSAALLGFYDVFKKQSLKDNAVIPVLFLNTLFSSLIFLPFIVLSVWRPGILENSIFYVPVAGWEVHRYVVLKSVIVLSSWMLGYFGMKNLPITIVGPINATRPVMVLVGALVVFGERLNFYQWIGVLMAVFSFFMLSRSGKKEGIDFKHNKWIYYVVMAAVLGAVSGLYDKYLMAPADQGGIGLDRMIVQSPPSASAKSSRPPCRPDHVRSERRPCR